MDRGFIDAALVTVSAAGDFFRPAPPARASGRRAEQTLGDSLWLIDTTGSLSICKTPILPARA